MNIEFVEYAEVRGIHKTSSNGLSPLEQSECADNIDVSSPGN